MEINLDMAGNAQAKGIKALESGDSGYSNQAANQLVNQIAKSSVGFQQNWFFQEGERIMGESSPILRRKTVAHVVEENIRCCQEDIKINGKREIKKSQEEKNQAILSGRGNLYCLTSLMTSNWSYTDQIYLNKNQKLKKDY
jgi:hypothetical protein